LDLINYRPLSDRVVFEYFEPEEKSAGGIYIPDTAKEVPLRGKVIAVGPGKIALDGKSRLPMEVSPGDVCLFGKYTGWSIEEKGKEFRVIHNDEILAVINED